MRYWRPPACNWRHWVEWTLLCQLCLDKQLSSNEVPDAWLSAAVVQLGEHLVSFDRDFRKLLARNQFTLLTTA